MRKAIVRDSFPTDPAALAPRLRKADLAELQAVASVAPLDALVASLEASVRPLTVVLDDQPIAMFGAVPMEGEPATAAVWLLGTDDLLEIKWQFLRESKRWLKEIHGPYALLWNYVDARNEVHIKWLQWMGFSFLCREEKFGVEGRPFYEFISLKTE